MKFSSFVLMGLALAASSATAFVPSSQGRASSLPARSTVTEDPKEVTPPVVAAKDPSTTVAPAVMKTEEAKAKSQPKPEPAAPVMVSTSTPASTTPESADVDRIEPGRYNTLEKSIALPFMKRPKALDGSHAGDFGFDPLGLTESYDLYTMQESELRHGRLAMLAVVGWPLSELLAPSWMLQDGRAPSVLNGFNPISFAATLAIFAGLGFFEYKTALRPSASTEMGKLHNNDMSAVWQYGVAGDYNFDPLNLYSSIGDSAKARKGLREVEISHGRSAMLGITGFVFWEKLTGHGIVENSMFFHPNALLPLLTVGYLVFNQVYEVSMGDGEAIKIEMTDEGNAKVQSWKIGFENAQKDNEKTLKLIVDVSEKAVEAAKKAKQYVDENVLEETK